MQSELLWNVLLELDIRSLELFCSTSKIYRGGVCQDQQLWKQLVLRDFSDLFPERDLEEQGKNNYKAYYYSLLDTALKANYIIEVHPEPQEYIGSSNILVVKYYFTHLDTDGVKEHSLRFSLTRPSQRDIDVPYENYKEVYNWLYKETLEERKRKGKEFTWSKFSYMSDAVYAGKHGNLAAVRWLHENGVPWDEGSVTAIIIRGDFSIFKYAIDHGAELTLGDLDVIHARRGSEQYKYLVQKGIIVE